jgi:hypothetical protein
MLLSSSKTKQTSGSRDSAPRKMLKSSKIQTTRNKVLLSSSSSSGGSDDDEVTVQTPPRREATATTTQTLVKIRYPAPENQPPHQVHVQLLQQLTYHTSTPITILNKRFETLKTPAVMALQNLEIYSNHFDPKYEKVGKEKEKQQITIIQPIQTTMTLSAIKNIPGVMEILKANNAYITTHEWIPEVWDVRTIGFITNLSPAHHPKSLAVEYVNDQTKQDNTMPQFRLKHTTIRSVINNTPIRVPVYAIEVQTKDVRKAEKVLFKTANQPDSYISFRMKAMNPTAFKHAVAMVAQFQNDLRTIVINNVSEEAYFVMENHAKQVDKVLTVHHLIEKNPCA